MKRCPQCLFIYPESDERCDFDNTPLVVVNDSEVEAATNPHPTSTIPTSNRKPVPIAIAAGIALGAIMLVGVYYAFSQQAAPEIPPATNVSAEAPVVPQPLAPLPSPSPSPSPSAAPSPKTSSAHISAPLSVASRNPVSTSGPGTGTKRGGKPVILLTSGGKIDADEVWRTRDGVWYRRNGMVTLLKPGRVKAIVNQ
jgi:hypothetical protein